MQGTIETRRVLFHFLKLKGKGIAVCRAVIPDKNLTRYCKLYEGSTNKIEARKHSHSQSTSFVVERQESAVEQLSAKKIRGGSIISSAAATTNALGFAAIQRVINYNQSVHTANQPSIDASMQCAIQTDIQKSNNTQLEMAIS